MGSMGLRENLSWPLRRAARMHADAVAVVDVASGATVTYGELARRTRALGAALEGILRVPAGGRVGVLAANSLAHLELFLGVPAAGRVVVSLNTRLAVEELAALAVDARLSVLVADEASRDVAAQIAARAGVPTLLHVGGEYEELVAGEGAPAAEPAPGELAAISYTGGTTGRPKGVMLSHGNLLANARHNLIATGHTADDRWLHVCPMFHVAGTANVVAATWVGAHQVILPRFDAAQVCATIAEHGITHVNLVPTMLGMLLDHERETGAEADLSSLRHIQYAASPIAPELQRRVLERFPAVDVAQFYGMTEAAPTVSTCTPQDHRRPDGARLASMGAPVVGVEVEVRDPETGAPLPPGEIGEVWVRGPNVMLGYWEQPDVTASVLRDGWYRTGDAAHADADGYLFLVDRLKDMIISGGENVYSVEVEAVLVEHPAVRDAAVFGVPHVRWGEAVHAVVEVDAEVSAEELVEHCRAAIAGFKVPRGIDVTSDPLPRSGAGKLLKHRLRDPFWAGRDRNIS